MYDTRSTYQQEESTGLVLHSDQTVPKSVYMEQPFEVQDDLQSDPHHDLQSGFYKEKLAVPHLSQTVSAQTTPRDTTQYDETGLTPDHRAVSHPTLLHPHHAPQGGVGARSRSEGHLVQESPEDQPRAPLSLSLPGRTMTTVREDQDLTDHMNFLPTSDSEETGSVVSSVLDEHFKTNFRNFQTRMMSGDTADHVSRTTETKLLPPTAFLLRSDGTLIENGTADIQPTKKKKLKHPKSKTKKVHSAPAMRADQRVVPPGDKTQNDILGSSDFVSPADEMIYIRNMLHTFQERKIKNRLVQCTCCSI